MGAEKEGSKLCPLFTISRAMFPNGGFPYQCVDDDCALWSGDRCSLARSADALAGIVAYERQMTELNKEATKKTDVVNGSTSDGYHTFDELYDHRAKLFSVVVSDHRDRCWKSMRHHDGTMYDGMFIVGIDTPDGQASYHYDVDPYWDMFDCRELDRAPEWDGHTPAQAIERIARLA